MTHARITPRLTVARVACRVVIAAASYRGGVGARIASRSARRDGRWPRGPCERPLVECSVVRYRVEQLASACEGSGATGRYCQSRGLWPPPEREGRVGWYGPEHVERVAQIRSLQRKGLTLAAIRRVLSGELGSAGPDLAAAVAAARGDAGMDDPMELLDLDAFSARSGVPASLIQAVEREGSRLGRTGDGQERYAAADIDLVRTALRLLEFGLPLADLLTL